MQSALSGGIEPPLADHAWRTCDTCGCRALFHSALPLSYFAMKRGPLPAVALSSREVRAGNGLAQWPLRSVQPVFLGAALVGWCQTMNMAG